MLFTFPSRYLFTIGHQGYLALEEWTPQLRAELACSALLRIRTNNSKFRVRDFHPLWSAIPVPFYYLSLPSVRPTTPTQLSSVWFGLLRFRSPLLTELFLFLRVLRCFSSPSSPLSSYLIYCWLRKHSLAWVSPFGHRRIIVLAQLPVAYRSATRPSSALNAKAFPVRP